MLSLKQIRMLEILDQKVKQCEKCLLFRNGKAIPSWHENSKYCIIGEAPGISEVRNQTPFNSAAGDILKNNLGKLGFKRSEFLIINSVQCRPNVKPSNDQLFYCSDWVRKYIKVVNPSKILCLGNYAKSFFTDTTTGVLGERGEWRHYSFEQPSIVEYPVLFTVHPVFCVYNDQGEEFLYNDLKLFKETKFQQRENASDWLFTEEEFMI